MRGRMNDAKSYAQPQPLDQVMQGGTVGVVVKSKHPGYAEGDKVVGFPPVLEKGGYKLTDPGRYQNLTDNFSAQIGAFKSASCEIVTGVVLPPDFTTLAT